MHRSLRYQLVALGLLASVAAAQGTGTLRGLVVDSVAHQPIARVLVLTTALVQGAKPAVLTDASGHFLFPNVPAGSFQIIYRRPGYMDPGSRSPEAVRTVSFVPGAPEPTFTLEPAATLQGQVVLPESEPPSGIRVDLYQAAVTGGHRYWRQRDAMPVESDGRFEFAGLEPGSYLLHSQASLDPFVEQRPAQARSGYLPVFAPETREMESASAITLLPGQTAEAKLNLTRAIFSPVSVQVTGAGEGVFPNFEVTGSGFTHWPARFDRQTSAVTMELPSGNYVLRAVGGRRGAISGTLPLHISEGAPPPGLSLAVNATLPATVAIHAVSTAATAAPGGGMRLSSLQLLPVDAPESQPLSAQLEQDGDSDIAVIRNGIPAGRYWVEPSASGGYIAQLTSQGTDLLSEPLSVSPGAAPEIHAVLRDDGGSITVTRDGGLLSQDNNIQVIPLFAGGRAQGHSGSFGGSTGEPVSFNNLAPGDYLVFAVSGFVAIAYREPGVVQQLKGTRVTVAAGATTQVTLSALSELPPGVAGAP